LPAFFIASSNARTGSGEGPLSDRRASSRARFPDRHAGDPPACRRAGDSSLTASLTALTRPAHGTAPARPFPGTEVGKACRGGRRVVRLPILPATLPLRQTHAADRVRDRPDGDRRDPRPPRPQHQHPRPRSHHPSRRRTSASPGTTTAGACRPVGVSGHKLEGSDSSTAPAAGRQLRRAEGGAGARVGLEDQDGPPGQPGARQGTTATQLVAYRSKTSSVQVDARGVDRQP
jgi:hypothetical protein